MLFGFRGIRLFQFLCAMAALACAVGATVSLKLVSDGGSPALFGVAVVLGLIFLWMFAAALRAPTSFLAVGDDRTRIRFAGFIDTVIENRDVAGARLVRWRLVGGLGVRTTFRGSVALASGIGEAAELTLRRPIRVWLIPGLWRLKATTVIVTVRNPAKLVERFGAPPHPPARHDPPRRKGRRR